MPTSDEQTKLTKGLLFWRRPKPVRQPSTHSSKYPEGNKLQRTLRRVWTTNITPETPVGEAPGFFRSTTTILFSSCAFLLALSYASSIEVILLRAQPPLVLHTRICEYIITHESLLVPYARTLQWALHFVWQKDTTNTQDTVIFVCRSYPHYHYIALHSTGNQSPSCPSFPWQRCVLRPHQHQFQTKPAHDARLIQLLAFATDELSLRVGQTLAGLLNATLVSFDFTPQPVLLTKCAQLPGQCVSLFAAMID